MSTTWSTYQENIFAWADTIERNLMVKAGAGCGKTTTIVELYKRLQMKHPLSSVLFMAFNKKIADELGLRGVPASTMNSFGFKTVLKSHPRIKLETNKVRNLAKMVGVEYKKTNMVARTVSLLKAYLYPVDVTTNDIQNIIMDFELSEEKIGTLDVDKIKEVFRRSLEDFNQIDFDDQICYPVYHNMSVPKSDFVIIDEAQDLSPNKLELVSRAVGKRFVCVGDPLQAIYGFCGADSESMDKIQAQFEPIVLSLPVTYRCGKRIVEEAHKRGVAPSDFQAGPDNHEGEVLNQSYAAFENSVQPKDFVLCRVTAPLVSGCFSLIKKGTRAQILGRDVGKKLEQLVDKISKNEPMTMVVFCEEMNNYCQREVAKLRAAMKDTQADNLEDQIDCLHVFTEGTPDIGSMKNKINLMFDDSVNPHSVTFSTIHKAKGLEADNVYCLPYKSRPAKKERQKQEEKNLLYVQITRAKNRLVWVKEAC